MSYAVHRLNFWAGLRWLLLSQVLLTSGVFSAALAQTLSINNVSVVEGNFGTASALFTVSLDQASGNTVTVDFSTADGTAAGGSDYLITSGTLTFNPGITSQTVSVSVVGDTLNEANETFYVNLANAVNAAIGVQQGIGTITDDDPLLPTISINDISQLEGNSGATTANFTVSLSAPSGRFVSVLYSTSDGTAKAGTDYLATSGTLIFPPGTVTMNLPVSIIGNVLNEPDKTFYLGLSNPNYANLNGATGIGTIVNDDPLPSIQIGDTALLEGNSSTTNATFTLSLSAVSGQSITVNYATADATAVAGQDYTAKSGTIFFAAGVTTRTVTVTVYGDNQYEADEEFRLNLSNPVNASLNIAQATGRILNDDSQPTVSINDVSLLEGNNGTTNASFTVSLSAVSGFPVSVNYGTANGTATAGQDYTAASGTLTIPAGSVSGTIVVAVNGDALYEPNETLVVSLSSPVNAILGQPQGTGTIVNDDGVPSISVNDVRLLEGQSGTTNAVFTVTLSNPSYQTVTLNYATADTTATTADNDYSATTGSLSFAPGQLSTNITVIVKGDNKFEADETFAVILSGAVNATLGRSQGVGTIQNDDLFPSLSINSVTVSEGNTGMTNAVFTLTLSNPTYQIVTVNYTTADGTATLGDNDYSSNNGLLAIMPGQVSGTITVAVRGDLKFETDEIFSVNLSGAVNASLVGSSGTGTIKNDDGQPTVSISDVSLLEGNTGTTNASFTVSLSNPSYKVITVNYATSNSTALAGSDYLATSGILSFAPGSTSQSLLVTINSDVVSEPDEIFFVNLSNPTNTTLSRAQGVGRILNDDSGPAVTISDAIVVEGNSGTTNAIFSVTLSGPSTFPISVSYATANGTAVAGSDYSATSGTLTLSPGIISGTISVTVNGDLRNESDETFFVNLSNPSNAIVSDAQGIGTILNDDPVPSLNFNDVTLLEGNSGVTNAVFTITLSAASGQNVTVNYATADGTAVAGSDYTATSGSVTFSPGITSQTIAVPVIGDLVYEANENFSLNLSGAVNAVLSRNQGFGAINNDDSQPSISLKDVSVVEGNTGTTNAVFALTLSNPSSQTVSVNFSTADVTAVSGSDYLGASGSISFTPGSTNQIITIQVNGDLLNETNETFVVNIASPVNATIARNQAIGTIINDDLLPSLTINDVTLLEGNSGTTNAVFTVTLSAVSGQIVKVNYSTTNGTATAGADYTSASGILTFNVGSLSQNIVVPVINDLLNEANETFFVNLSSPSNAIILRGQGTGTISNDDLLPSISISDGALVEGNSGTTNLLFPVTLSAASGQTVTVGFSTSDGTALAASDYIGTNGTLTFSAGVTALNLPVAIRGDTVPEPSETFSVTLSSPGNATIARAQAVGTIVDNESRTVSFTNSAGFTIPTLGPASIYPSPIQFSGLPGTISKVTVGVAGLNHTYPDDIDVLLVGPGGQKVLLMSDCGGSSDLVDANLIFDSAASGFLPDASQVSSGTYKPTDYGPSDSFPSPAPAGPYTNFLGAFAGTNPNGAWSLYVYDDSVGDGGSVSGGLWLTLTTTNLACCSSGSDADLSVTMSDSSDPALTGANLTYSILVVNSGPAAASGITLTDTLPSSAGLVSISTSQGTSSQAGGIVTCSLGSLGIGSVATVNITVNPSVTGSIMNSASVSGVQTDSVPANNSATTATIVNLGPPSLSINDVAVVEPNVTTTNAIFLVTLSHPTDKTVTVNFVASSGSATAGTDFVAGFGQLSFAPGVTAQTIAVAVNGDLISEPDETFFVSLSSPTNATVARSTGTGTIQNNDGLAGQVDHFVWNAIAGSPYWNVPFSATLRAVDPNGTTVTSFSGPVSMSGIVGAGTSPSILITELDTSGERMELANVGNFDVDLSGWQASLYDWFLWPDPEVNFVVPAGTICRAGDVFVLQSGGIYPGSYPNFSMADSVYWLSDISSNQIAVLLQDASGQAVDFVCAVDGNSSEISYPMPVSASQWSGVPVAANSDPAFSFQRVGSADHNNNSDWVVAATSIGARNGGLTIPFPGPRPVMVSPAQSGNFAAGIWSGSITVMELVTNMYLRADDGQGHVGNSAQFTVQPGLDLSVSGSGPAGLVAVGSNFTCVITVTNRGAVSGSGVTLTNVFSGAATFISAFTSQGTVSQFGNTVSAALGSIALNGIATLSIVLRADAPGSITNTAIVSASIPDYDYSNNSSALITKVNFPPAISGIPNQTINEDTSTAAISFIIGDNETPAASLSVSTASSNGGLLPNGNISLGGSGANRTITITPLPNQFGNTIVTITVGDGLVTTDTQFMLTVQPVNDPPVFTKGPDQTVLEDSGPRSVVSWATSISGGPANESTQQLTFQVSNNNTVLFSVQPAVSSNGTLTFTPATNANGTGLVTAHLQDDGGTANGGANLSSTQSFNITISSVNDAPSFAKGADQLLLEDSGSQSIAGWATGISAGPADEATQTLNFVVTNNNNSLFSAQPAISPAGTLTYTSATNANGSAIVTVRLHDNAGTASGGSDTSAPQTFNINVTPVNDSPILGTISAQVINEGIPFAVTNAATDVDGTGQTLTYQLINPPAGAVIGTNGVITWTPTEAQGPGTYTITTVVSDNGVPVLSATNGFQITVLEVNSSPALPVQGNRTVNELTALLVSNGASDLDIPSNALSYQLINGPAGAVISSSGVINWTPTEAQGPGVYTLTTVVTDNGAPNLSATNSFTVTVNEVNRSPVLAVQGNRTVNEGTQLVVTNTAGDPDIPANGLSYQLPNGPAGAVIDDNGVITWTPSEGQGPGAYTLTTVVTDNGVPALSATNSFTVTVNEANTAPVLGAQPNRTINELTQLVVNNGATDGDIPANGLSYQLLNAPAGAVISGSGVISWTPTEAQGPGSYTLTTVATDNGVPNLSATNSFIVTVNEVNVVPVLPTQNARTINELTQLVISNTASDSDLPANALTYQLIAGPAGAVIDGNGVITWTPTEGQGPGTYVITTTVTDNGVPSLSAANNITVTVNEVNSRPVLPVQVNRTITELTALVVSNTASDLDVPSNGLSYQLLNGPAGAVIDDNGVITWTPSEGQGPGTYTITTVVTDDGVPALSATNSFTVTVNEANIAPQLAPIGEQTVRKTTLLTFTVTATDGDLPVQALSYSLDPGAPAGASISPGTGVFSWTPTALQGPSTNLVTIRVADNGTPSLSDFETIRIVVTDSNSPPVLAALGNLTVNEQALVSFTASASDSDIPAQVLTYSLDAGAPAGASIDASTGVFNWTPTEAQGPSTNYIVVRVTDNGKPPASESVTIMFVVNEVNRSPVLAVQGNRTVNEGTQLVVTNTASDPDIPANRLSYQLPNGPAGAVIDDNGVITWTPSEGQGPGTYTVTTVVTDNGVPALSATNSFTVTVNESNTAPVLGAQPNRTINELTQLVVNNGATDGDIPANGLSYQLLNAPAGAVISGSGVISWTPTEAQGPGSYTLTTVATDNGVPNLSATNSFIVTVNEVNVVPVLPTQNARTINELTQLVISNTASDSDLPANALTYQLIAGPAGAVIDGNGVITWTPTEGQGPGTYVITTTVTDNGVPSLSAANNITVTVNEVNSRPVLPVQVNRTITELTALVVSNMASDLDVPSNGLSYQLLNGPAGAVIDDNGVITWTPSEGQGPGTYTITTVVTDDGVPALSATNSFTVTVNEANIAPQLAPIGEQTVRKTTLLTFTVTATDGDLPVQALSYSLDPGAPAGASISPGTGVFSWTPTALQGPSTNLVTIRVADNGTPSLSDFETIRIVVTDSNSPPVLAALGNLTVNEQALVSFTASASDSDIPAQVLTYSLDAGAPAGASIDASTGVFNWTPTEAQGPSTNYIVVRVTDNGKPPASDSVTIMIVVNEVNNAPALNSVADQSVVQNTMLAVTNQATDLDFPANSLTFTILSGPIGAAITSSGIFTWTPTSQYVGTTNLAILQVTDNGVPPLSDYKSFFIRVTGGEVPAFQNISVSNSTVFLTWSSVPGSVYRVQYKSSLDNPTWIDLNGDVKADGVIASKSSPTGPDPERFYRLKLVQ